MFIFTILGFLMLMLFELGSVSALPEPWHLMALTPLALIAFVVGGWGREVWGFALLAGLLFDSFVVFPSGTFMIIMVLFVGLVRLFLRRWFTTRSWLSTVALISVSVATFFTLTVITRGLLMLFQDSPLITITFRDALWTIVMGTIISTIVGMASMGAYVTLRYFFGRRFILSRNRRVST